MQQAGSAAQRRWDRNDCSYRMAIRGGGVPNRRARLSRSVECVSGQGAAVEARCVLRAWRWKYLTPRWRCGFCAPRAGCCPDPACRSAHRRAAPTSTVSHDVIDASTARERRPLQQHTTVTHLQLSLTTLPMVNWFRHSHSLFAYAHSPRALIGTERYSARTDRDDTSCAVNPKRGGVDTPRSPNIR